LGIFNSSTISSAVLSLLELNTAASLTSCFAVSFATFLNSSFFIGFACRISLNSFGAYFSISCKAAFTALSMMLAASTFIDIFVCSHR